MVKMELRSLATFCAVVSEGNMTTAAEKLSITQPAVSQQIRQLEKEFEVKLLTRNVRRIRPTVQGQILYAKANKVLNLIEQVRDDIKSISFDLSGAEIKASTLNSLGLYLISPVIGNFLKLNNEMKISLLYGTGEEIIRRMQRDEVDMVIMGDLKKEYGKEFTRFQKIHLFKDYIYFVKSGRDTSVPKNLSIKDINKQRLVMMQGLYPAFENQLYQKLRDERISYTPSFQSDNVGTLKRVIESGLGWGFLPAHSIRKQLRLGRLSAVQIEGLEYSVDVNLYYKSGQPGKEKIIQILKNIIQRQSHIGS